MPSQARCKCQDVFARKDFSTGKERPEASRINYNVNYTVHFFAAQLGLPRFVIAHRQVVTVCAHFNGQR